MDVRMCACNVCMKEKLIKNKKSGIRPPNLLNIDGGENSDLLKTSVWFQIIFPSAYILILSVTDAVLEPVKPPLPPLPPPREIWAVFCSHVVGRDSGPPGLDLCGLVARLLHQAPPLQLGSMVSQLFEHTKIRRERYFLCKHSRFLENMCYFCIFRRELSWKFSRKCEICRGGPTNFF